VNGQNGGKMGESDRLRVANRIVAFISFRDLPAPCTIAPDVRLKDGTLKAAAMLPRLTRRNRRVLRPSRLRRLWCGVSAALACVRLC
jgi:hypothetical protein